MWALGMYFVFRSIEALAGKNTSALFQTVVDMSADRWIAWIVAAGASGGYLHERRLRRRTIEGKADHEKLLEQHIDARRSGSGLTKSGDPKKEDVDAL